MREYGIVLVGGITSGSMYGLLGASFGQIFFVTGRFHFAYGVFYALAGLLAAWLYDVQGWAVGAAVVVALLAGTAGGVLTEVGLYRRFDKRGQGSSLLGIFIASLGVVVAGEAILQLVFDEAPSFSLPLVPLATWQLGEVPIPEIKVVVVMVCWAALTALHVLLRRTRIGREIRAVEASRALSETLGIDVKRIFTIVFATASLCAAILGVLVASSTAATAQMGGSAVIYAFVVAFLGKGRSPLAIGLIGLTLGVFEAFVAKWFGQVSQELVVFVVLFVFIAALPYAEPWRARILSRRALRAA